MKIDKLKKDLLENSGKLVFGTERSLNLLKNDRLKAIYIASNCMDAVKSGVKQYSKDVEIIDLEATNSEVGVVCKKPFFVSVIGLTK
ncbi:MAG: ribosomal L7Ae/L30e/S12e/Gadd45 family protein [Nanoarchaeota archaeon]